MFLCVASTTIPAGFPVPFVPAECAKPMCVIEFCARQGWLLAFIFVCVTRLHVGLYLVCVTVCVHADAASRRCHAASGLPNARHEPLAWPALQLLLPCCMSFLGVYVQYWALLWIHPSPLECVGSLDCGLTPAVCRTLFVLVVAATAQVGQ